jgi:hypothetical protein
MLGISIDVGGLAKLIQELASWHPDTLLQKAKDSILDPEQAYRYFLVYLNRAGTRRDLRGIISAVNYLFAHCLNRTLLHPQDLSLRGDAKIEGDAVLLSADESIHSTIVVQPRIGERLLWGIRYRFSIEDGVEVKISIADMTFALCTEDHPGKKSRVFLYDKGRDAARVILQESGLVARRDQLLLATLFLFDHNVWYVVDDKVVFAIELSGDSREQWRNAQLRLSTWRSRCVRIQDITVFEPL